MNQSMQSKNTSKLLHWLALFGIVGLVVMGTAISAFSLLAFAIAAAQIVFGDEDFSWQMIFFLAPFAMIFKLSPGSMSLMTFVLLLFVIILFHKYRSFPSLWIFFAIYMWIGPVCTMRPSAINVLTWIKVLSGLLMVFYFFDEHASHDEGNVFLAFIVGQIAASFACYLDSGFFRISRYIDDVNTVGDAGVEFREVVRFAGLNNDPNYYSVNLILSICLLIILLYQKRISIKLFPILFVTLLYLNMSTYSKSAMLMLALPVLVFVYTVQKSKRGSLRILLIVMIVAAIVFLTLSGGGMLSVTLKRFASESGDVSVNKLTTGRFDLWMDYIEFFKENPGWFLFGRGLNEKPYRNTDVHNAYIETLYRVGLIGTCLFLGVLKQSLYTTRRPGRKNFLNYCLLIGILIEYMFLNMFVYYDLPFHIVLVFSVYNMKLDKPGAWLADAQKGCSI